MTFSTFINEYFPIDGLLPWNIMTAREIIEESDGLPYDDIRYVDGSLCKVVRLNDEEFMAVHELLSYSKEDVDKCDDIDFKELYSAYMENVEIEEVNLENISALMREMRLKKQQQEDMFRQLDGNSK